MSLGDLLVRDGLIADFGPSLGRPDGATVIEADGAVLCPGLVDMRAALGEPGFEYRETIASAAVAAAAGGITTLAALPDTQPAIDDPALVQLLRTKGDETGSLTILPYGAVTRGCRGEELSEIGLLREAGAVAFTDGARAIGPARLMRLALSYARGFGARIVQHPEEPSLAGGGAATESEQATRLGLPGIPAAAEAIMVARDIRLAELTGGAVHFAHVSTGEALGLIRAAKAAGLAVTCDTAPPYFDLNETSIGDFRTYAKLSPPLAQGTRPEGGDRRPGRRHDRCDRVRPPAARCRRQAPAVRTGVRRRFGVGDAAGDHAGACPQRIADAARRDRSADGSAGGAAGRAERADRQGRGRRSVPVRSRSGSGRSKRANCRARRRTRRSTGVRWRVWCWERGSSASGFSADAFTAMVEDR